MKKCRFFTVLPIQSSQYLLLFYYAKVNVRPIEHSWHKNMTSAQTTLRFNLGIPDIPEEHRQEAEYLALEIYIMTLLRHHDISMGQAAKLLEIDRWQLSELMSKYQISPFAPLTREELAQEVLEASIILDK
jgi:predicted HTH domain antitoxin